MNSGRPAENRISKSYYPLMKRCAFCFALSICLGTAFIQSAIASSTSFESIVSYFAQNPNSSGNIIQEQDLIGKVTVVVIWNHPGREGRRVTALENPFTGGSGIVHTDPQIRAFDFMDHWRKQYQGRDFQVIGIMPERKQDLVTGLFKHKGWEWNFVFSANDPKRLPGINHGFTTTPTFILFDRNGQQIQYHNGTFDLNPNQLTNRGASGFMFQWMIARALEKNKPIRFADRDYLLDAQMHRTPNFDYMHFAGAYMFLYHYQRWNQIHTNEFEYPKAKEEMVDEMKARVAAFDPEQELSLYRIFEIGNYDAEKKAFPLLYTGLPVYHNSNRGKPFPRSYGIDLNQYVWDELGMHWLPMDSDSAAAMIKRNTHGQAIVYRGVHAMVRYKLGPVTDPMALQIYRYAPIVVSVSFYDDNYAPDPFYVFKPKPVPMVSGLNVTGPPDYKDKLNPTITLSQSQARKLADEILSRGYFEAIMGEVPKNHHWPLCVAGYPAHDYKLFQSWWMTKKQQSRTFELPTPMPMATRRLWHEYRILALFKQNLFLTAEECKELGRKPMAAHWIKGLSTKYKVSGPFVKMSEEPCY